MTLTELTEHLLARQNELTRDIIVCTLALALHINKHGVDCRYTSDELAVVLNASSPVAVSSKLTRMKITGLVSYKRGTSSRAGYTFTRIGPA